MSVGTREEKETADLTACKQDVLTRNFRGSIPSTENTENHKARSVFLTDPPNDTVRF